jgi:four helix bundle protein
MKISKFEDFEIWKDSMEITKSIYRLTNNGEFSKDFGLRDQIRKSTISISANIVEGFEKNNNNEFIRFLKIAKGSVGETRNHLYIALGIGYIDEEEFNGLNNQLMSVAKQLSGFISYLVKQKEQSNFRKVV